MQPICLTFDNGPEPETTPGVLDVLARRGLAATFFVIGGKLRAPGAFALAERARAEGHRIGNHTLTHGAPLGGRGAADSVHEIAGADALMGALHGPERLFRPNGGGGRLGPHLLNAAALRHLEAHRHTVVLWNAVPGDFRDPEGWPATAWAMIDEAEQPVLLVLHDKPNGAMRHLDRFLGRLLDAGAVFTQEPPDCCVPLRRGVGRGDIARYVTRETT
ncbi:polysaccharide deacetylase family protein [Roseococcus sp. SYP-B2431]|uniref:polysaccharide deacetylase family protein n=1 Tax=Roseococcus sp. SYP-B2431 TaxID=2496640 RepID=UPI00103A2F9E|nr:polysaccharide deacetylase family protein [Roseococcus sp. SYP-B2431]TCH97624.1 polysaccharide deacetylase family protein [Roseococcus sp. SYP-B2431]